MTFVPTAEQEAIVASIEAGNNLAVQALAGTGKTATLLLGAEAKERRLKRGYYVAFGRSNKTTAEQVFPGTVQCTTSHGLAFESVGRFYWRRVKDGRRTGEDLAQAFGVAPFSVGDRTVPATGVAIQAKIAVQHFCYSADAEITSRHVPRLEHVDDAEALAAWRAHVVPYAKAMWDDATRRDSAKAAFSHDHYLKIWSLSQPRLDVDFVMLDEVQDANALLLHILTSQQCQLIAVGDSNQQLYAWRKAVDALSQWPAHTRLHLTESFRFGPPIAAAANQWLEALDCDLRVVGRGPAGRVGPVDRPDAVLCRTNAGAVEQAMVALLAGRTVGMADKVIKEAKSMSLAAMRLQQGHAAEHEALATFDSWQAVRRYVDTDPTAGDLAVFVRLVEKYGAAHLLKVVKRVKNMQRANVEVAIVTGHMAKGLQWPRVQIASDFREPSLDEEGNFRPMDAAELRLCYVATTRAQQQLDDAGVSWIDAYLHGDPTEAHLERWYAREIQKAENNEHN